MRAMIAERLRARNPCARSDLYAATIWTARRGEASLRHNLAAEEGMAAINARVDDGYCYALSVEACGPNVGGVNDGNAVVKSRVRHGVLLNIQNAV